MVLNIELIVKFAAIVGLILGITIHEFSHALAARLLGDRTAERMGRLSLNPLVHLDPMGTLMMLITVFSGFGIGWGKPTPVTPWNLRPGRRLGMALVAAGGPLSNFLLALLIAPFLLLVPNPRSTAGVFLSSIVFVNLGLAAFNLLPLPILDGFHILMGAVASIPGRLASNLSYQLERLEPHGPMLLLVLILLGSLMRLSILSILIDPIFRLLISVFRLILTTVLGPVSQQVMFRLLLAGWL